MCIVHTRHTVRFLIVKDPELHATTVSSPWTIDSHSLVVNEHSRIAWSLLAKPDRPMMRAIREREGMRKKKPAITSQYLLVYLCPTLTSIASDCMYPIYNLKNNSINKTIAVLFHFGFNNSKILFYLLPCQHNVVFFINYWIAQPNISRIVFSALQSNSNSKKSTYIYSNK